MSLGALLLASLNVTLPVFVMVFIGYLLRRLAWIDYAFVTTASQLVFRGTMPVLIFLSIIRADLDATLNPALLAFFALATLCSFLASWGWAVLRVPYADRGSCIQGAFRGNCGIVGLALAAGMYGEAGLSTGGLLLGVVILTYNAFSVVALASHQPGRSANWRSIFTHIVRNPLILAVVAAVPVAALEVELPIWLVTSAGYFASLTLPLALICVGATLSLRSVKVSGGLAFETSLMKMVALPALATGAAWLVGFEGRELGVLFLFFASPTAAAAFVMAKAMGGNATLTANIIALSTLMASVTITLGAFGLKAAGLI
ncbi:AEC family transporter [Halomonas heilongjiangensis]|uniref:AEC family transporter n=1 Tax=Halomonas heilongjiangensis TaxID=1387883 RepID=A0A2N7TTN3_9GAMM|nr:AEC family transporter [Halomonas heilongjiangensis]PMR71498.1 AEC family transporter [Halomonas heilongjiangensis]PXX94234.1 malate transporter [Halomonas heilongjiangensis]